MLDICVKDEPDYDYARQKFRHLPIVAPTMRMNRRPIAYLDGIYFSVFDEIPRTDWKYQACFLDTTIFGSKECRTYTPMNIMSNFVKVDHVVARDSIGGVRNFYLTIHSYDTLQSGLYSRA